MFKCATNIHFILFKRQEIDGFSLLLQRYSINRQYSIKYVFLRTLLSKKKVRLLQNRNRTCHKLKVATLKNTHVK